MYKPGRMRYTWTLHTVTPERSTANWCACQTIRTCNVGWQVDLMTTTPSSLSPLGEDNDADDAAVVATVATAPVAGDVPLIVVVAVAVAVACGRGRAGDVTAVAATATGATGAPVVGNAVRVGMTAGGEMEAPSTIASAMRCKMSAAGTVVVNRDDLLTHSLNSGSAGRRASPPVLPPVVLARPPTLPPGANCW